MLKAAISVLTAAVLMTSPSVGENKIPEGWLVWHSYTDYSSMDSRLYSFIQLILALVLVVGKGNALKNFGDLSAVFDRTVLDKGELGGDAEIEVL